MSINSIDFFIHEGNKPPRLVNAPTNESLEAVLQREGVHLDMEVYLFVSEAEAVDKDGKESEPLSLGLTIADSGIKHHSHVHCHRCQRIQVTVNFQSRAELGTFPPNTPIRRIRRWAQKTIGLTGPAAGDFVLQPCGSDVDAGLHQWLSEFVQDQTCAACFDLTKEVTPHG